MKPVKTGDTIKFNLGNQYPMTGLVLNVYKDTLRVRVVDSKTTKATVNGPILVYKIEIVD